MIEAMGGAQSVGYRQFRQYCHSAYLVLRRWDVSATQMFKALIAFFSSRAAIPTSSWASCGWCLPRRFLRSWPRAPGSSTSPPSSETDLSWSWARPRPSGTSITCYTYLPRLSWPLSSSGCTRLHKQSGHEATNMLVQFIRLTVRSEYV